MTVNHRDGMRYDEPVHARAAWINALRYGNSQYQANLMDVDGVKTRQFRDACNLTLLQRLLPNLKPELLGRLITSTQQQPRFG